MKETKIFVLNSGGLDSTTLLASAVKAHGVNRVHAINVTYGQRHDKELLHAEKIANYYQVQQHLLDLSTVFRYSDNALMKHSTQDIKTSTYAEQKKDDLIVNTYVPFRNGLMLAAVASFAKGLFPHDIVEIHIGVHQDDYAGASYADTSQKFVDHMNYAISEGTYGEVTVVSPFVDYTKAEVVALGLALKVPYELTWSCYLGGEVACGQCATCKDRIEAFTKNNTQDKIKYEVNL